ncbi:DUF1592 domain-containing protein [Kordiimonas aquimaris]|uniref:DUF1592 domain-containing protein n=1 Tax=Kordiimonas aquimaris TaxID=707591 RepID=UPI0021D0E406|nr:DUF1592 domain-containing protein [Kordiimonas aquimaris]
MHLFVITLVRRTMVYLLVAATLVGCSESGPAEPETQGAQPRMRLVTTDQYVNTLMYVFGSSVHTQGEFSPAERTEGLLANGAAVAGVSASLLEQFQRTAASVAAQVVDEGHRHYLIPCKPASEDAADNVCATEFLSKTGRLLFGRALNDAEITAYVASAETAAESLEDFYRGLATALEGMLISPDFLFVLENAEPDPRTPGKLRLDAYSVASRLSYFFWNASPDAELLDAAESGELQTEDGLARAVDRMLASPRLDSGMRAFFDDMFAFDDFNTLSKDPLIYPTFTSVTAVAAREQTLRTVINHLINNEEDYRDLFTTRSTFISPELAVLYDMPAPSGWTPYTFPPDSLRAGLLTHVSFLALHAHPGRSSPTLRGKALRELLLCQHVPPPPPDVDFSVIMDANAHYPTQRERVAAHLENPSCAGCHRVTDPTGLSLENFNGEGRVRLRENNVLIDATGDLDGVKFENVVGLGQALRNNTALPACLVQRLYSYGSGGPTGAQDNQLLEYFNERFAAGGYRLPNLLRTIGLSESFSRVKDGWSPAPMEPEPDVDNSPEQHIASNTHNAEPTVQSVEGVKK